LESISENKIDLILLDINMPEINGLTFAKVIDKDIKVIFTTAHREYAVDGFDINAVDYLLKPISYNRFFKAIKRYFTIVDSSSKELILQNEPTISNSLFVRSERKMVKILFDEILYVESLSDYVKIFTKGKTVVTRETITNMESRLPSNNFLRIHRSYIIAIDKIEVYTNEYIEIEENALPISRSFKEKVLKKLKYY